MSRELFAVTPRDPGVVSLQIATDADPYLGPEWVQSFVGVLVQLGDDRAVRAVVLEGTDRYFQAGASRAALTHADGRAATIYSGTAARALLTLPVPVIAAAAGHATGGGLLLALWCDVIVLAAERLYGANFMALGFSPGFGATVAVPVAFGEPLGRELLYTGRLLTGREIRDSRCPLAHAVQPQAAVLEHAWSHARAIAEAPRDAIELLKQNLASRRLAELEQALSAEDAAHARLFATEATRAEIARRYPDALQLGGEAP